MRIGVDFDNTIVCYDDVFTSIATSRNNIPQNFSGNRVELRESLRRLPDGEKQWMSIQGQAYGKYMTKATLISGVDDFFRHCCHTGIEIFIISHKTKFGHYDPERIPLRDTAMKWLEQKMFFDKYGCGLSRQHVYFESTRDAKINRINSLRCTHFIDDLDVILTHPNFADDIIGLLFDQYKSAITNKTYKVCRSWREISDVIFKLY